LWFKKENWWFFFIIEFAIKISILFCNNVKFCTHKKAIWEEHFMWLFSIHKLMSNINEQGWNDIKLGYEATKLTYLLFSSFSKCILIFIISKCIKVSSPHGFKPNPLPLWFLIIHVVVVTTCTNIVKLLTCKCSFDIILVDYLQIYLYIFLLHLFLFF